MNITFRATIPPIMSAIKIGEDGIRIQLDVPEVDMPAALPIVQMRGKIIKVTLEADNG